MAQVLCATLCIQIDVRTLTVKVSTALELIVRVRSTALLDSIEDEKTVILVEFEGLRDFFWPGAVLVLFFLDVAILPVNIIVFICRGVLE